MAGRLGSPPPGVHAIANHSARSRSRVGAGRREPLSVRRPRPVPRPRNAGPVAAQAGCLRDDDGGRGCGRPPLGSAATAASRATPRPARRQDGAVAVSQRLVAPGRGDAGPRVDHRRLGAPAARIRARHCDRRRSDGTRPLRAHEPAAMGPALAVDVGHGSDPGHRAVRSPGPVACRAPDLCAGRDLLVPRSSWRGRRPSNVAGGGDGAGVQARHSNSPRGAVAARALAQPGKDLPAASGPVGGGGGRSLWERVGSSS